MNGWQTITDADKTIQMTEKFDWNCAGSGTEQCLTADWTVSDAVKKWNDKLATNGLILSQKGMEAAAKQQPQENGVNVMPESDVRIGTAPDKLEDDTGGQTEGVRSADDIKICAEVACHEREKLARRMRLFARLERHNECQRWSIRIDERKSHASARWAPRMVTTVEWYGLTSDGSVNH